MEQVEKNQEEIVEQEVVDNEDLKEYTRSLLGMRPFEKTYTGLGGDLSITFRTLMVDEAENASQAVEREMRSKGKDTLSPEDRADIVIKARVCCLLKDLTINGEKIDFSIPEGEWMPSIEYVKRFGSKYPDSLLFPIIRSLGSFENLTKDFSMRISSDFV